ncbi:hypothetical protein TIFTF001_052290 [Ficus carica]|uniref:Uncharacterized protein n=1 Tax=Ficus carica TaxID=3494 RepID=A0AA88EGZ9_FICCA|nr:hypothetical protein TIFTF001_052284 [Ficus carica]GMN73965.1 hypothetical protein TIFTF001_052286 [Ficus carica]GMN73974.1 hypothetical protein TIFTF001_052288 [Ficus carica]GMN73977.1 hypothetical protein TIFTF001_052290 [Ficus carica]
MSAIRSSTEEFDFLQQRKGVESSNEVSERSRPATVSGAGVLYIPPIAQLNRPPQRISMESFLRTANPSPILTEDNLALIKSRYGFPNEVQLCLPFANERADTVSEEHARATPFRKVEGRRKAKKKGADEEKRASQGDQSRVKQRPQIKNEEEADVECILRGMELIYRSIVKAVVIKRALRRLFGSLLFIESLSKEVALITRLSLDMIKIDFPSPKEIISRKREEAAPCQKVEGRRKAKEKGADEEKGASQGDRSRVEQRTSNNKLGGGGR